MNIKKVLGAIIIIILLLLNIFLLVQNQNLKSEVNSLNIKISNLEERTEDIEDKPPLGWEEYVNEKYKFKMWYPKDIDFNPNSIYFNFNGTVFVGGYEGHEFDVIYFAKNIPEGKEEPVEILYMHIYNSDSDINKFIKNDMKNTVREYNDIKKLADDLTFKQVDPTMILDYHNQYEKNLDEFAAKYIEEHITRINNNDIDLYKFEDNGNYYLKKDNLIFVFMPGYADFFEDLQQIYETMVKSFRFVE